MSLDLRPRWSLGPAVLAALVAGCQAPPRPPFLLQPPAFVVQESLVPGGALGPLASGDSPEDPDAGAAARGVEAEGTRPVPVRCRILYLRTPRAKGLKALAGDGGLVADLKGPHPVLRTPVLTASTLGAQGEAAGLWIQGIKSAASTEVLTVAECEEVIPGGSTLDLGVVAQELVEDPRDWLDEFSDRGPIPRGVRVSVTALSGEAHVALTVTDLDPEREAALREAVLEDPNLPATAPPPAQDEKVRRETLELVHRPGAGEALVLHIDPPFDEGNGTSLAIIIEHLESSLDEASEAAAIAQLSETEERLAADRIPLTEAERLELQSGEALEAFRLSGGRAALLQVAQETDARLAQDLAVVADTAFLASLRAEAFPPDFEEVAMVRKEGSAPETAEDSVPVQWRLEAASWRILASGALEETLDPELSGVLYRHAGALAAFPDIVQDILRSVGSSAERFGARMMTEQRYFLEDASPAARLRAYDWLLERGADLGSFDPLGERAERRAALEALAATATQKSTDGDSR